MICPDDLFKYDDSFDDLLNDLSDFACRISLDIADHLYDGVSISGSCTPAVARRVVVYSQPLNVW